MTNHTFTLRELKQAIPDYCFHPSLHRSLLYLSLDIGLIIGFYILAYYIDFWFFLPLFWIAQGTMFWALFVIGHDCGHHSFSKYKWVNNVVGHLCHTPLLVPFHGWKISHRIHHQNTGNLDTDETWYPISEKVYNEMPAYFKFLRYRLILLLYPLYLFKRSVGRDVGSHFSPNSPLFKPSEKYDVLISTICCFLMAVFLGLSVYGFGILWLAKYYLVPYIIFIMWLDFVTYLHHTDPSIPWYRGKDWSFLKGNLSTVDHDYGLFNKLHHNIGTHVVHHIFATIPHYHLVAATAAIKPILGDYYRCSEMPVWRSFWHSYMNCYFVPNDGSPVYYKTDSGK
jgi:omega-3 fatty acid desaturase (delta-15 desaturase)